jgi:EmrB/QacA subfamily drug resistance transporter
VSQTVTVRHTNVCLALLTLVLFVTFLDNTIVAVALPAIQVSLHAGITALQWVVSGYALTFAALMLPFGTLGDHFGRRRVMVLGLGVFTCGSVLGAVATSSAVLIAGRVIMGVGAAASEPGTLSLIRQLYPESGNRARALGVWSAVSGLALASGPVIGGILTGLWSWRAIFVFNCVVAVIAIIGVQAVVPEFKDPIRARLDIPGFVWGATALTAATFGTIVGETSGYRTWWVLAIFGFALVALFNFLRAERSAEEPVLDVRLFRRGAFSAGMLTAFTGFFATFAVFFFIPLFVQLLGTQTPYDLVVDFVPMAAAMILASALSGRWIARRGPGIPMALGCLTAAVGIFCTEALISPNSGVGLFGWTLVLVGAGLGVVMVGATAAVLGVVPAKRSGMAASAVNTSRELGAVAGVAILGAIIYGQLTHDLIRRLDSIPGLPAAIRKLVVIAITTGAVNTPQDKLPKTGPERAIINQVLAAAEASFTQGLEMVLILAASLLVASALVVVVLTKRHGNRRPKREMVGSG